MSQAFFSPNNKMTGGAILASFNSKDANVYFKVAKQVNNNPDKKNFDFQNAANFKFSADETAGMFRAIRTCGEFKFYHSFTSQDNVEHVTSGSLRFYSIPAQEEGKAPKEGFGFTGKKDNVEYKCGFTVDSAERLAQYLQFALEHIFASDYSEDKKRAEEWAKNNPKPGAPTPTTATPKATTKPKTAAPKAPTPPVEPEVEAPTEQSEPDLF